MYVHQEYLYARAQRFAYSPIQVKLLLETSIVQAGAKSI